MTSPKRPILRPLLLAFSVGFLSVAAWLADNRAQAEPIRPIDQGQAQSAGIRKLTSHHLELYTDVPSNPDVDRLPAVFDEAVPQWAAYFGVDEAKTAGLQARAYLIGDRRRFEALKLMPAGHAEFVNGISLGAEMWLNDQPTAYYRRHLLLHEGTHVFMSAFLGGCGPGWYMEGTAELMATHRFDEQTGRLELRIMPRSREEVPMLGRIKLIRDAVADGHMTTFPAVMLIDNRQQLGNEAYAWCWSASKFLDAHPRYGDRFHRLTKYVLDPNFNELMRRDYAADWPDLIAEWQAYIATLDYGYDYERMAIDFQPGRPLGDRPTTVKIAADRGWQSSGILIESGRSYRISASGRYQITSEKRDATTRPWMCEPGGVTIDYHDGKPLGMLIGALDERYPQTREAVLGSTMSFERPFAIGLGETLSWQGDGTTLYLRINDSPAHLDDNRGSLIVTIEALPNVQP